MTHTDKPSILEQTRPRFREMVENEGLLETSVTVLARPLTPEEAIGTPGRQDYPIITGKERVVECSVLGSRGHAFTDSPREFQGTLRDVLDLRLNSNQDRAVYVATLNAVMGRLNKVTATVHCKDDDPEHCARDIAGSILEKHGRVRVGLIGLNPAIAENLVQTFGADQVRILDLSAANIGQLKFGVEVRDGSDRAQAEKLIDASDVVVLTGTTLVNGTFDQLWERIQSSNKDYLVYGVTAAGACQLHGIQRICPRGQDG